MSFTRTLLAGALGLTAALVIGEAVAADPERLPPLAKPKDVDSEAFSTSGTCALCHAGSDGATAMKDAKGRSVAPYDLWQSTMMANSSRDPLWRAVVSAEVAATPNAKGGGTPSSPRGSRRKRGGARRVKDRVRKPQVQ